jgi:hypothetical protein
MENRGRDLALYLVQQFVGEIVQKLAWPGYLSPNGQRSG